MITFILRKERGIILACLAGIAAIAWIDLIREARALDRTGICSCVGLKMSGPDLTPWTLSSLAGLFLMWAEMMVAMMIPSAAPMILTFAAVEGKRREQGRAFVPAGVFAASYILVWTAFSAVFAVAQWTLHSVSFLSPRMSSSSSVLGIVLLSGAGVFQFTPWKRSCLQHCRSPLAFLLTEWREGIAGAFRMGFKHGAYCTGCCWLLMAILFVAGVMNIWWVALISIFVLFEKLAPCGNLLRKAAGILLVLWGAWIAFCQFR